MHLKQVFADNFRLLSALELAARPGLNLILGPNAAGKTSVLEAVFALGRGRSFRGSPPEVAGPGGPRWHVRGRIESAGRATQSVSVAWSAQGLEARLNQGPVAIQELVRELPVQVLEPDSHRLLEDGPAYRRRYLDWGVFHVEHRFYPAWRRYQRALRQRNRALKDGQDRGHVEAWNPELCDSGEEVNRCREAHLEALRERLGPEMEALLEGAEWTLDLARGWPAHKTLAECLEDHFEQDRRQAQTVSGPHRAELRLRFGGRSAKHQVSRGQQKLLVAALLLAQSRLIAEHGGRAPVLLIDDFPAELGEPFQRRLLRALAGYPGQVFLTSIERTTALSEVPDEAVFHVEHGVLTGP